MKIHSRSLALLSASAVALLAAQAQASGFALIEQSGSGMGNAFAGGAAAAEDASTIFYNPAGISRLNTPQAIAAFHIIDPSFSFHNRGSAQSSALSPLGIEGGSAGKTAVVPNVYVSYPLTERLSFGLGLNAPFGLKTDYAPGWIGRYQALKSDIKTVNVNPTLAYKVTDTFSVGAGFNAQHFTATLTNAVNYSAVVAQASLGTVLVPGLDGLAAVHGRKWGYGFNLGALWQPTPTTRLGIAYRSKIVYNIKGDVAFTQPTATAGGGISPIAAATANAIIAGAHATATADGPVALRIVMPDSASASIVQELGAFDLMGDVTWTGWKVLRNLNIFRGSGAALSSTPENFRNTWRFSLGGNWRLNDRVMLRAGTAYDKSPVRDQFRTARLPDADRYWGSVGARVTITDHAVLNVAFTHIWLDSPTISDNQLARGNGLLAGTYSNHVNMASAQFGYMF